MINLTDVKVINNFIEKQDIDFFTNYIDENYLDESKFRHRVGLAFNKGLAARAVFPDEKPASLFKELKPLIDKYSVKFIEECRSFYSDDRDIYFYGVSVTRLSKDIQIRIHQDIHNDFVDLLYSGILYLNDDYEGGEVTFLDNYTVREKDYIDYPGSDQKVIFPLYDDSLGGAVYKPKRGDLVILPALKYHGGKVISSGNRDSIILWTTLNKQYEFEGFESDRVIGDGSGYLR